MVKTELNIAEPKQITPNDKEKYDAAKVAISFFQVRRRKVEMLIIGKSVVCLALLQLLKRLPTVDP